MMTLSEETIEGLQITGYQYRSMFQTYVYFICYAYAVGSFLEVAPFLLEQPGAKFLYSVRFNQDNVEAYFGLQRSKGGRNDNPTVKQFCDNAVSLRLYKGQEQLKPFDLRMEPLTSMKHHSQKGKDLANY